MNLDKCPHCGLEIPSRPVEDALRTENDALRAQWQSVPWNLLSKIADLAEEGVSFLPGDTDEANNMFARFNDWFNAHAPKEAAE